MAEWFYSLPPLNFQAVIELITAVSTAAAAAFAAWSAWTSRSSARAAEAAVEEARRGRKAELSPRLLLERNFLDFAFYWPHPLTLNGEPVFLARRHWRDTDPVVPTFSLTNYGASPGLEVRIAFTFEDPNGELTVPDFAQAMGITTMDFRDPISGADIKNLQFARDGRGNGLPLYDQAVVEVASSPPGIVRSVEFPQPLLNRLLLRGLQYWEKRGAAEQARPIIMTARVTCRTIEGDPYETQFRFEAFPFWQGVQNPLEVNGHFRELPMYPVIDTAQADERV